MEISSQPTPTTLAFRATSPESRQANTLEFRPLTHIRSREDICISRVPELINSLDFDTGFFTDERDIDLRTHRWVYKKQREVARRMAVFRGEVSTGHPPFPAGSNAACVALDGPLPDARDIKYSAEDDDIIDQWLRQNIGSPWPSLGTCKMAPRDHNSVVDGNLSVYEVEGLKIADLSIVSRNVGANTHHTALVIGEKAASIFIRELDRGKE